MARFGFAARGCAFAVGLGALACGSGGGGSDEEAAGSSESGSSSDEGASSDESGEACVADCAPGGTVLLETSYGMPMVDDYPRALAVGADGRIAITGYAVVDVFEGTHEGWVALLEADGTLVFETRFPDEPYGVGFGADDGVLVGGNTPAMQMFLRAYDDGGAMAWETIDVEHGAGGGDLTTVANGEIVMGGGDATAGMIARYSATGEQLSYVQTPIDIYVQDVVAVGDGVVVTGSGYSGTGVGWAGMFDGDDQLLWQANIGGGEGTHLALADDGNVAVVTQSTLPASSILVFGSDGTQLASGPLPRAQSIATDLAVLPDGDIIVVGGSGDYFFDAPFVARMNAIDSFVWQADHPLGEMARASYWFLEQAPDGTLVTMGQHYVTDRQDIWIQRIAPG
jgi:hypothetical protein